MNKINLSVNLGKKYIKSKDLSFEILPSGDIYSINNNFWTVNMYRATSLDGMIANIYLRITKGYVVNYTKLLGVDSNSSFKISNNQMLYTGKFDEVDYSVHFKIKDNTWFWEVELKSENKGLEVELFYGQDISLNSPHANQAYACQYIDHSPFELTNGYHVLTKQNEGAALAIQQGSLTPNVAYATDGFDFFGKLYKKTNKIEALVNGRLPSRNYQYELAYTSFQTPKVNLNEDYKAVFYASFTSNFKETGLNKLSLDELSDIYNSIPRDLENDFEDLGCTELNISYQDTLKFEGFSNEELVKHFPERILEEVEDGKLLSWFTNESTHFMNGEKEDLLERPQGNIIINNGMREIDNVILTSTNYIFGIFNSQIALGNSQFNRMLTINKTPLNILKTSGQRLFVKINGKYQLLALAGLYEMDVNSSSWYYKIKDASKAEFDILKVQVAIANIENKIVLKVSSLNGRKYDFVLASELVMNDVEHIHPIELTVEGNTINYSFNKNSETYHKYPEYSYQTRLDTVANFKYSSDDIFYKDGVSRNNPILSTMIENTNEFSLSIFGLTSENEFTHQSIEKINQEYQESHLKNSKNFNLSIEEANSNFKELQKFNVLVPWYVHDALVHYSSPHGLEQFGGAAWGTRDICQGPIELFTSFDRFDLVRKTILTVYTRQFEETGDWPQWFMFDRFSHIQADSSHGDIIVWPLYAVGRYMIATGDKSILNEVVPYTSLKTAEKVHPVTVLEHIMKQINTIKSNLIEGTYLSSYGGGDWDDTLQPAQSEARNFMVSSWTVALTIQAIEQFLDFVENNNDLKVLVKNMKDDYVKYFIKDNVPAGFIEIKDEIKYIVHPKDEINGINYRLLTFNQGILSELFTNSQIEEYLDIIDKNLLHPDGVRLMDTTVKYQGGTPKIFMRAETATNFGREISLHYIHAHIRYIEAMNKIGEPDRLFTGLKVINPILIKENVPNALTRQSNVYFSSSDGNFINRYVADENFDKLRTGEVEVKGGWRLYSSGPGIYLNQLIANFLGVNSYLGDLYLDPVLPVTLDGLNFKFDYKGVTLDITYEIKTGKGLDYLLINGKKLDRNSAFLKYRPSGVIVPDSYLIETNKIVVRM